MAGLHYINTLKREFNGIMGSEETSTDKKSVVNSHLNELPFKFSVGVKEHQDKHPTSFKMNGLKQSSLQTLALALLQNFLNY